MCFTPCGRRTRRSCTLSRVLAAERRCRNTDGHGRRQSRRARAPRRPAASCACFANSACTLPTQRPNCSRFRSRSLAVLAVPDVPGIDRPPLTPARGIRAYRVASARRNGGSVARVCHAGRSCGDGDPVGDLPADDWSYVALGHYHVYRQVAPRAWYSGSIDYTSSNPWGELREERDQRVPGKGFIEHDLVTGASSVPSRFADAEADRSRTHRCVGNGRGRARCRDCVRVSTRRPVASMIAIVRASVWNVPRHIVRELDHVGTAGVSSGAR